MKRVNMSGLVVVRPEHKSNDDLFILSTIEMESIMMTISALKENCKVSADSLQQISSEIDWLSTKELTRRIEEVSQKLLIGLK